MKMERYKRVEQGKWIVKRRHYRAFQTGDDRRLRGKKGIRRIEGWEGEMIVKLAADITGLIHSI